MSSGAQRIALGPKDAHARWCQSAARTCDGTRVGETIATIFRNALWSVCDRSTGMADIHTVPLAHLLSSLKHCTFSMAAVDDSSSDATFRLLMNAQCTCTAKVGLNFIKAQIERESNDCGAQVKQKYEWKRQVKRKNIRLDGCLFKTCSNSHLECLHRFVVYL